MPNTTNYNWVTPSDSDLVKDGAAAIRTLGSSIDTSVKALSPGTTAGDIDYYTSSTAKTRVAIGTTGQVLTVSGGVPAWAAAPSSIPANSTATVATSQSTTSTTYTNLTTSGPAVTVTTGTKALIIVSAKCTNGAANVNAYMDFDVSGATTRSATDTTALVSLTPTGGGGFNSISRANIETLTAGSNTFTAKYRAENANGATFANRSILVINLA